MSNPDTCITWGTINSEWFGPAILLMDDLGRSSPVSRQPSRPASRNALDDSVDSLVSADAQIAQLQHELASDALRPGTNIQGISGAQNIGASTSHTFASVLGASLSRSTTLDPQLIARAPSPRLPPVGGGRISSVEKRNSSGSNSFNSTPSSISESADLVTSLSGMSLSTNGVADEGNHLRW